MLWLPVLIRVFELFNLLNIQEREDAVSPESFDGAVELAMWDFSMWKANRWLKTSLWMLNQGNVWRLSAYRKWKTTLINYWRKPMILGEIIIDGHSIEDITRHSLRNGFGMVLQETWLWNCPWEYRWKSKISEDSRWLSPNSVIFMGLEPSAARVWYGDFRWNFSQGKTIALHRVMMDKSDRWGIVFHRYAYRVKIQAAFQTSDGRAHGLYRGAPLVDRSGARNEPRLAVPSCHA